MTFLAGLKRWPTAASFKSCIGAAGAVRLHEDNGGEIRVVRNHEELMANPASAYREFVELQQG